MQIYDIIIIIIMSKIKLKTDLNTIKNLRESGKRLAKVINKLGQIIKPGMTLKEIDKLGYELLINNKEAKESKDKASLLGYQPYGADYPYPTAFCLSVNDVVAHGIPDNYKLKEGDIIAIDSCLEHKGMITDYAVTFPVGKIDKVNQELLEVTKGALEAGVKVAIPGNYVQDISKAIQNYISKEEKKLGRKFGIIKLLAGHGVGYKVHEEPLIPNFDDGERGPKLVSGMVLAIEPMINLGTDEIYLDKDGYSFKTQDGKNSAHFEYTILITKNKPEILTTI